MKKLFKWLFSLFKKKENKEQKEINNKLDNIIKELSFLISNPKEVFFRENLKKSKKLNDRVSEGYPLKPTFPSNGEILHEKNVSGIRKEVEIVKNKKSIICDLNDPINKTINKLRKEHKRILDGNITQKDIDEYNDDNNLRRSIHRDYEWKKHFEKLNIN